ncbi:MAG: hypothetical protein C0608_09415 [Deltaproteobacteria bacterium]|nr:MAG: hypothetical protein C0608_09415 [Deltaproteobacteria bacterium]
MSYLGVILAALLFAGSALAAGPFGGTVNNIVLSSDGRQPLYAATERGLYIVNNGKWQRVDYFGLDAVREIARSGDKLLALKSLSDIYVKTSGDKWRLSRVGLTGPLGHSIDEILSLAVDPALPRRLYLGSAGKGAFVTQNSGRDWDLLWEGIEENGPAAGHVSAILVPRLDRELIIGTKGAGLFVWRDKSWKKIGEGLPLAFKVLSLTEEPGKPTHLAMGTQDAGLWESLDAGKSWKRLRTGAYNMVSAVSIGIDGSIASFFPGEGFVIAKEGRTGRVQRLPFNFVTSISPAKGGGWYASMAHDGLAKINGEGLIEGYLNNGLEATTIKSIISGAEENSLWCGDMNGVFYSDDGGENWQNRDEGLITGAAMQLMWLNGDLYMGDLGQGVFIWLPESGKWKQLSEGLGTSNSIYKMDYDAEGRIFVGTEGGVMRLDSKDKEWVRASAGLPESVNKWSLAINKLGRKEVYAGGSKGLFVSEDGGKSWRELLHEPVDYLEWVENYLWVAKGNKLSFYNGEELVETFSADEVNENVNAVTAVGESLFIGTDRGLYLGGDKKRLLWSGAGVDSLLSIGDEKLYAGTDGMGVKLFKLR